MTTEGQEPQETTEITPPEQPQDGAADTFDRAYVEKLRKENASYRTRAKELEDEKIAAEAERLKQAPLEERLAALEAERETLTTRIETETRRAREAELIADLTGKVIDPKAAMRLWEDDDTVEAFLERHPYMTAAKPPFAPAPQGQPDPAKGLKAEDFRGKSQEWIAANLHRLKKQSST